LKHDIESVIIVIKTTMI